MRKRAIKEKQVAAFAHHLRHQEKSQNTIKQYVCALTQFMCWLQARTGDHRRLWPGSGVAVTRDMVLLYKEHLCKQYKPRSGRQFHYIGGRAVSKRVRFFLQGRMI